MSARVCRATERNTKMCSLFFVLFKRIGLLLFFRVILGQPSWASPAAVAGAEGRESNEEKRLLDALFRGYDKRARPLHASNDTVPVALQYWLVNINDLNERLQQLETVGWIQMVWVDEYLTWNPADYGQLQYIVVSMTDIWYPDIVIRNRVKELLKHGANEFSVYDTQPSVDQIYGSMLNYSEYRTILYPNGTVSFTAAGRITTFCSIDLTYFPFDRHACAIRLVSWTYFANQLRIDKLSDVINAELYSASGQWSLVATNVTLALESFGGEYMDIAFTLHLSRKPAYYGTTLVLPCALMSVMVLVVFLLPAHSYEKVSFAATMLLSFSVFQLLMFGIMPQTSDYTPVMTIYLLCVLLIAALSLFTTVLIVRLHHNHSPVPPSWLQTLAFAILARLTCTTVHLCATSSTSANETPNLDDTNGTTTSFIIANAGLRSWRKTEREADRGAYFPKSYSSRVETPRMTRATKQIQEAVMRIRELTSSINVKLESDVREREGKKAWQEIARVMDRLFLGVYVTATVAVTAVILGIYPQVGRAQGDGSQTSLE